MNRHILIPVTAMLVTACAEKTDFDAQGTFEATEITVSAETPGRILALDIEDGECVAIDQHIGLIDTTQLHLQRLGLLRQYDATLNSRPDQVAAQAALREQIDGAATERDRMARLLADGAATRQQLDNADTRLASLKGELAAMQSQLNSNTASLNDKAEAIKQQIAAIDDRIARSVIKAPVSGTVLTKIAEAGEVATFGTPLFRLGDMSDMYLRAYFTSDQLSQIHTGQHVTVMADYGGGNTRNYDGTISFISPTSEFTPKTIQTRDSRASLVYAVKIAVHNDGLLKIGLTGQVYLNGSDNGK